MLLAIRQHDEDEEDKKTLQDEEDKTLIVKQEQFIMWCNAAGDVDCEARALSMARCAATPHPPYLPGRGAARRRTLHLFPSEGWRDAAPSVLSMGGRRVRAPHHQHKIRLKMIKRTLSS